MPRSKLKLAYITEEYARRASLKKRRESLKKKLYELTTLCGVDACAIIYSPNETEAELWPCEDGVKNVLDQLAEVPEMDQTKKLLNHQNYIKKRITKTALQLNKQTKENREKEMANKMSECIGGERSVFNMFIIKDLNDLESLASDKVSEIDSKLKKLMEREAPAAAPPPQPQPPQPQPQPQPQPPQPQPTQPEPVVCYTNPDNVMVAGVAADGYEPVEENPGILHGIQTPDEWYRDYNIMGQPYFGFSQGDHMHVGDYSPEDAIPFWSGASSSNATL